VAGRDLLKQLGNALSPADSLRMQANVTEATRTASRLNPTSAPLHAQLAEVSAELGMLNDAARAAKEALRLDKLTPHTERKLPAAVRKRLTDQLPEWEKAPPLVVPPR
jgi:hypothetical protein